MPRLRARVRWRDSADPSMLLLLRGTISVADDVDDVVLNERSCVVSPVSIRMAITQRMAKRDVYRESRREARAFFFGARYDTSSRYLDAFVPRAARCTVHVRTRYRPADV